eukprot:2651179-Rhodomonas_salina.1
MHKQRRSDPMFPPPPRPRVPGAREMGGCKIGVLLGCPEQTTLNPLDVWLGRLRLLQTKDSRAEPKEIEN